MVCTIELPTEATAAEVMEDHRMKHDDSSLNVGQKVNDDSNG